MSDTLTFTRSEDGLTVVRGGTTYRLLMKFSSENAPWKTVGIALADSAKQTFAMYGVQLDEGTLVAGEFVLGMAAPEGFAGLPRGLVMLQAMMPNLGRTIALAVPSAEIDKMKDALRAMPGHQDGVFGPRGSVLVFGKWSYRGTWPARVRCLEVQDWIALGNKNTLSEVAREIFHAAKFGLGVSQDIAKITGQR